ncbi:MAG: hypothetical protein HN542_04775 [Flavobacteriales bacterium]|jgi:hypothetical protein|nr:hypothetical protein [Flavobacteriales bacterium]NCG28641.1 hypothetical protein [Verrucomicrobiales bacterium]MBT3963897.1 hypothetical protein [Flavobacteriales bacterium]MBT4706195.1 hypothetical protein [Flavobacteriales bacterium]MBT4931380.1 hypothetical protein [Flavobacteriales bacterium]
MNKYHKISEKVWLVIAVLTFVFAVYKIGQVGISDALVYLVMAGAAATMYTLRYYSRKRLEKHRDNDNEIG